MTLRRLYVPTVLGLLVLGGGAWLASRRPWSTTTVGDGEAPGSVFDVTGADVVGVVGALAVVVMACALAVLASAGGVRRAVGVVGVLASVAGAAATFADDEGVVDERLAAVASFSTGDRVVTDATVWPWVTAGLFAASAVLGIVVVVAAPRWPSMSSRYEAPGAAAPGAPETEADWWKALDEGRDPTDDSTG